MYRIFNRYWSKPATISLVVETLLLFLSVYAAYRIRFWWKEGLYPIDQWSFWYRTVTFVLVVVLTSYFNGLYDFEDLRTRRKLGVCLARSLAFSALVLWAVYYLFPILFLGRGLLSISFGVAILLIGSWRAFIVWVLRKRFFSERIIVVGSDEASREFAREILNREHLGYQILGFISDDPELQGVSLLNPVVIGSIDKISEIAQEKNASRVVVAQKDNRGRLSLDALLRCKTRGIPVEKGADYLERLTGKIDLEDLRVKSWLVFSKGFVVSPSVLFLKRCGDFLAASIGLVLSLPVTLLTAIAILIDSGRPIFFRQERVGKDGKVFAVWKFRSMTQDAEAGGARWAVKGDSRITRVGKIIRQLRIDELPQLWNVLVGDMSLVGPRPERKQFVDELIQMFPLYEQRLVIRPGLTGWAQINAAYAASFEESLEKLQYDLFYIKNLSVFLDLSIIAGTLRAVLIRRGAH